MTAVDEAVLDHLARNVLTEEIVKDALKILHRRLADRVKTTTKIQSSCRRRPPRCARKCNGLCPPSPQARRHPSRSSTRYARGQGLRAIAKALNERGVPSAWAGKRGTGSWAPSALWAILRRTRYLGVLQWNRMEKTYRKGTKVRRERQAHELVRVEAPHLRIVSDELWTAAHGQMRATKATRSVPVTTKKGGRPASYLLSGITKCGKCGGSLTVIGSRDGKAPIKVYVCSYRHDRGEAVCTNKLRRPMERVNDGVIGWIKANILSDELLMDTLDEVRRRIRQHAKTSAKDVPQLEAKAHKLRAEIANLVDILATTPRANAEGLVLGMNERQEELNALETRIRTIKAAPEALQFEVRRMEEEAKTRIAQLRDALERNPREARAIIDAIFEGKLTATPIETPDGPRFAVEGVASVGRMLAFESEPEGSSNPPPKNSRPQGHPLFADGVGDPLAPRIALRFVA